MKSTYLRSVLPFGALVLGAGIAYAPTIGVAADFSGKTIQIIMPSKEGSGTDKYARIFQPFLAKHLPGKPTVIVVSKPGGSGVRGSNWFEEKAAKDGTMIITTGGSVQTSFVFGGKKVKYNLLGWNPIVLSPFGLCLQARKETGVKGKDGVADVKALRKAAAKGRLLMGDKNSTASGLISFVAYDLLGISNVKPLYGLSSGKRRKAIKRGEIELSLDSVIKCKKQHKKLNKLGVVTYMTIGFAKPDGSIGRDPILPKLPHIGEVYEKLNGKKPSGLQWQAVVSLVNIIAMSNKGLWLPKGASKDTIKTYDVAIKKIYKDKKFKKLTKKRFGENPQSYGEDAKAVVRRGAGIDPKVRKWIVQFINKNLAGT